MQAIALPVLYWANREDLKADVSFVLGHGAFALCVLDDLTDWEEDYDRRRFTYPLQLAFERENILYKPDKHDELKKEVLRALCYGPVYHELMKEVSEIFKETSKRSEAISMHLSRWLYAYYEKTMASWREHVEFLIDAAQRV